MIKENQKLLNYFNVITDIAVGLIAITASYFIAFYIIDLSKNFPLTDYVKLSLIFIPVQLLTFGCMGLYDSFRTKRFTRELELLFFSFIFDGLFIVSLLYIIKVFDFSRITLAVFLLLDLLLISLKRFFLRRFLRNIRKKGYNKKKVLIVGSGKSAQSYLKIINEQKIYGFECTGYISEVQTLPAKWLGGFKELLPQLQKKAYDEAICALNADESHLMGDVVEACELTGTKISIIPSIYNYMSPTSEIDLVGNIPVINIRKIPLDNIGNAMLKRLVDIIGSFLMLVLTSPVILISMLIIKLTMGGQVIFKQRRVGLNKKEFTMYKLKSMRDNDRSDTAWSTNADSRKTRFGAFIRKFSIDELPQLFNVLKGDMSLVGPRPEIPFFVDKFKDQIPMYMIRHQVKPGITGLAQINGYRGDTSIAKRVEYDVKYIEEWSIFLDMAILIKTAMKGFVNSEKLTAKANNQNAEEEASQTAEEKQEVYK